ncbi:two-component system, response regulator YesN [Selenomonas ruminantium]|uniref:Two-component system, response regulator YesN n=1 Tax=Selenomonas ruminantium TaxID=971 RepID=A0A1M6UE84_SELRU|nr:response regulator [Selenomonas ruminantium]SHK67483.1 two-component system, response regulator YesN [Selenomonas ruminantium]
MLRIVLVEDEDIIRRGLVETVDWAAMGAEIAGEAADGEEALPLIRELRPDVLITDIRMTNMDGLELARRLRAENIRPKLVFLTSYTDFEYVREALRLQAADYLLKPVDDEALAKLIRKLGAEQQEDLPFAAELSRAAASKNPYVRAAWQAITEKYQHHISLEQVAEEQLVSVSYLSRKLKEEAGDTFGTLLAKYRLQQAVQLLRTGTLRVYEVAEQTGFGDYKNFCQVFRRYLHTTPRTIIQESIGG